MGEGGGVELLGTSELCRWWVVSLYRGCEWGEWVPQLTCKIDWSSSVIGDYGKLYTTTCDSETTVFIKCNL